MSLFLFTPDTLLSIYNVLPRTQNPYRQMSEMCLLREIRSYNSFTYLPLMTIR